MTLLDMVEKGAAVLAATSSRAGLRHSGLTNTLPPVASSSSREFEIVFGDCAR